MSWKSIPDYLEVGLSALLPFWSCAISSTFRWRTWIVQDDVDYW